MLEILCCDPKGSRTSLRILCTEGRGVHLCWTHSQLQGLKETNDLVVLLGDQTAEITDQNNLDLEFLFNHHGRDDVKRGCYAYLSSALTHSLGTLMLALSSDSDVHSRTHMQSQKQVPKTGDFSLGKSRSFSPPKTLVIRTSSCERGTPVSGLAPSIVDLVGPTGPMGARPGLQGLKKKASP